MRTVDFLFKDLASLNIYLDDLTPHSIDFDEHLELLKVIFERLI